MDRQFTFEELHAVVAALRGENGCPWDRAQTHESMKGNTIEEAYEVNQAVSDLTATGNPANLCEELGDLLLQVMLHSQIAEESGEFTLEDVIDGITRKMIRRHPACVCRRDLRERRGAAGGLGGHQGTGAPGGPGGGSTIRAGRVPGRRHRPRRPRIRRYRADDRAIPIRGCRIACRGTRQCTGSLSGAHPQPEGVEEGREERGLDRSSGRKTSSRRYWSRWSGCSRPRPVPRRKTPAPGETGRDTYLRSA